MTREKGINSVRFCAVALLAAAGVSGHVRAKTPSYAVAVSASTSQDAEWRPVVDALLKKHGAELVVYDDGVDELQPRLAALHPRYTCFVVRPDEASRAFVAAVHGVTRRLDDDPYVDTLWGILTGYTASNALQIARLSDPLVIRKVGAGTEFAMEMVEEGISYDELKQGHMVRKEAGKKARVMEGPADTTKALVDVLVDFKADLFITSGHATERDWQIGYRYRNGSFRSRQGQLYGQDTKGNRYDILSPNPKVYLPIGNCLMGHINGPDSMALAWMNSAGVCQMIGYTKPTWFGYMGWGCLDYFVEQPGRYTLTEAFFANHHALTHALKKGANRGLEFDRDVVAFYGDPAWSARMADRPKAWDQSLREEDGVFTFEIIPRRGADSFKPINTNGSQRGWRPIVAFLPRRIAGAEILEGQALHPEISDDFVLIPNPRECDPARPYKVVFREKGS